MEPIEIIHAILKKNIYRTHGGNTHGILCLHTYEAVIAICNKFPQISHDQVLDIISQEIYVKSGKLTTFIWGYSVAARKILKKS